MIFDRFDLVRQLPAGRHGALWQATMKAGGRSVALKQLFGVDDATAEQVRAQLARVQRLPGPYLVGTHDPVADADGWWLVEDWVDGTSLAAISIGSTGLTAAQTLGVIRGVLIGLTTAHRAGVVHGELTPRSIMITTEGQPVVVGFAAREAAADVAGADGFASPEAKSVDSRLSTAADVFSVGAMTADLLERAGIPAELQPVLTRATAEAPADRQADAAELLADLASAAERAYGAMWWTTAGLGGVVASTITATVASTATGAGATGATATGSPGAIAAAVSAGDGALAGATLARQGSGAVKAGSVASKPTALIVAGVAVALVAVVVGAVAVLRPGNTTTAEAGSGPNTGGNTGPTSGGNPAPSASRAAGSTDPRQPGSSGSNPAGPSRTPSAAQPTTATFRVVDTVTRSTDSRWPVGKSSTTRWTIATSCQASCALTLKGDSWTLKLAGGPSTWSVTQKGKNSCWVEVNGKETDRDTVAVNSSFSLTVTGNALTGGSTVAEVRRCKHAKKTYQVVRSFAGTKIT